MRTDSWRASGSQPLLLPDSLPRSSLPAPPIFLSDPTTRASKTLIAVTSATPIGRQRNFYFENSSIGSRNGDFVLLSCDAAASAGTWRRKPPAAHMAHGASAIVPP